METQKFYITDNKTKVIYYSDIKYAVIKLKHEYACVYCPELKADANGIYFEEWAQGHYFENQLAAKYYIIDKLQDYAQDLIAEYHDIKETIKNINKGDFIK